MRPVRPSVALVVIAAIVVLAVGAATRWRPESGVSSVAAGAIQGVVPVSSTTLVCPDASAAGPGGATDVTLIAPVLADTSDVVVEPAASYATATSLEPGAVPLLTLDAHGPAVSASVDSQDLGAVVVRTVGPLAPGLSASQLTTVAAGEATGIAAIACTAPSTESWFVGVGTELGHRPVLWVVNPEEVVAEVDVAVYGPDGPLEIASLRDVVVPANAAVSIELDTVAPDLVALGASVHVRSGRVVAGVRDSQVDGLDSLGVDWLTSAAPPSTRVVVPGVRGGPGQRILQLLAPGELDTRVQLRLLTTSGAIVPAGLEDVELTAGALQSVDLAGVLGADIAAIEVTADQPLAAGLRVVTGGPDEREMSYAAAAAPLTGPAFLADARVGGGWSSRLVLTADDGGATGDPAPSSTAAPGEARIEVQLVDAASGEIASTQITTIPAGTTVDVPLVIEGDSAAGGEPARFSVIVTPITGVVYGALHLALTSGAGAGITQLPLVSPVLVVDVPYVRQDLSTGLRPRG